jgi:hypothetical protein
LFLTGVNKEDCRNVKEYLRLNCSSLSSVEDRRIRITEMCLCYSSSCSKCICLNDDWDFCKGSKECTFLLPQSDITKIESQLTPSAVAVWASIINNVYIKAKYTCLEGKYLSPYFHQLMFYLLTGVTGLIRCVINNRHCHATA